MPVAVAVHLPPDCHAGGAAAQRRPRPPPAQPRRAPGQNPSPGETPSRGARAAHSCSSSWRVVPPAAMSAIWLASTGPQKGRSPGRTAGVMWNAAARTTDAARAYFRLCGARGGWVRRPARGRRDAGPLHANVGSAARAGHSPAAQRTAGLVQGRCMRWQAPRGSRARRRAARAGGERETGDHRRAAALQILRPQIKTGASHVKDNARAGAVVWGAAAHPEIDAALGLAVLGLFAAVAGEDVVGVAVERVLVLLQRDQLAHDRLVAALAGRRLNVLGLRVQRCPPLTHWRVGRTWPSGAEGRSRTVTALEQ